MTKPKNLQQLIEEIEMEFKKNVCGSNIVEVFEDNRGGNPFKFLRQALIRVAKETARAGKLDYNRHLTTIERLDYQASGFNQAVQQQQKKIKRVVGGGGEMNLPQREIKFRLIKNNKIVGYEWFNDGVWCYSEDGEMWDTAYIEHDEKNQYTGLKGKNGKEIYEGDIIECEHCRGVEDYGKHIGEVVWSAPKFGIRIWAGVVNFHEKETKIIGNIYENPELLREEEK